MNLDQKATKSVEKKFGKLNDPKNIGDENKSSSTSSLLKLETIHFTIRPFVHFIYLVRALIQLVSGEVNV